MLTVTRAGYRMLGRQPSEAGSPFRKPRRRRYWRSVLAENFGRAAELVGKKRWDKRFAASVGTLGTAAAVVAAGSCKDSRGKRYAAVVPVPADMAAADMLNSVVEGMRPAVGKLNSLAADIREPAAAPG